MVECPYLLTENFIIESGLEDLNKLALVIIYLFETELLRVYLLYLMFFGENCFRLSINYFVELNLYYSASFLSSHY